MPTTIDDNIPYKITGPAIINILTPKPRINPSFLNSIAGAVTELEKPVIGTIEPAPANFPILLYNPKPVKSEAIKISIIDV